MGFNLKNAGIGMLMGGPAGAAVGGLAGSKLSQMFGAKAGQMAGNAYEELVNPSKSAVQNFLNYGPQQASQEVMADPRFAALFDEKTGQLGSALSEASNLQSRGYSLQPEDYEAYGQASGDIARMFGSAESGLAQALAARGLSRSGAAPRAFMTSQGNKMEQLAKLQTNIAQKRMDTNMQRLNQTRNYINQLTGQYQGALADKTNLAQSKGNMGLNALGGHQAQLNNQFEQRMATADSGLAGALRRGVLGTVEAAPGMAAQAGLGAATGGASMAMPAATGGQQQQRRSQNSYGS